MDREPTEHPLEVDGLSPQVRERVLRSCRRAMADRLLTDRRRKQWRNGSLVAVAALLLLWNGVEERRIETRLQRMTVAGSPGTPNTRPTLAPLPSLRARAVLVAALLRDLSTL